MSEATPTKGRPGRLWLLVVVVAIAVAGAWYSSHRRSTTTDERVILGRGRPLLLDFGMGVCAQCKRMKPVMEQAGRELGDLLDVHVLDIRQEQHEELARQFQMTSMPLVVLVDGTGKELWRHAGFIEFAQLSRAVKERLGPQASICAPEQERCTP